VGVVKTILLIAALAAALPVAGQGADDAEKLFRKMEQRLVRAKTLRVAAEFTMQASEEMKFKGTFSLAPGDRARLAMISTVGGKTRKGLVVSDGKQMQWSNDGVVGSVAPTTPKMNELFAAKFARAGIGFSFLLAVRSDVPVETVKSIDELYPASGFRFGKKEKVDGRATRVVEHKLTWAGKEPVFAVTVWLDAKTNLPMKRRLTATKDGSTITITEVYTDVALDGKLDDKLFTLPR
jgi:outer membrane lipoprotein-sorting protein